MLHCLTRIWFAWWPVRGLMMVVKKKYWS